MKQISLLIIVSLFLPTIVFAAFNDVRLTTGTTLQLTVSGTTLNLTVTNGTVQSVNVENATLSITLAGGSSIDLTSADRYTFSYAASNAIIGTTCDSSSSSLSIVLAAGQTTETVSVSPTTTVCQVSTSGGGGSTTTTTTTTTTTATPSPTTTTTTSSASAPAPVTSVPVAPAKPATPAATIAPAPTPVQPTPVAAVSVVVLTKELNPGTRSNDVMDLQKLLAKDPSIYPEGTVSGFYGPKTVVAVRKFQAKYGLPQVGRVGPATLAKINEVLGSKTTAVAQLSVQDQTQQQIESQIKSIQEQIKALTTPAAPVPAIVKPVAPVESQTTQIESQIKTIQEQIQALTSGAQVQTPSVIGSVMIDTELNPGTRSDEVMDLQKLLAKDPEIYPEGTVSGLYGPKTTAAVKKFQAKYGLPTVGRVGPATMAKINEVLGSVSAPAVPAPVVPSTPTPTTTSTDDLTKQIEAQIKAIQDQIKTLQK